MDLRATERSDLKRKYLLLCIVACAALSSISMLFFVVRSGGIFTVRNDFDLQMIPFSAAMNNMIRNWSGQWAWNLDLGTQMIGGYGYYGLGSPFFWPTLLFDKSAYPYLMAPLYVAKYTVAGALAYLYISYFVRDYRCAVFGAVLYAFSGFQNYNLMFFIFHDVVALFPLLLIGLEELMRDRGRWVFTLAVFLNCLTNYFFFVGEVVFLILYFLVRWTGTLSGREMGKRILQCLACGCVGVAAAGILFVPSVMYILDNPRADNFVVRERYSLEWILVVLKGFLFPVDAMHDHFALEPLDTYSVSCYLPFWGIAMPAAYVIKKRDWISRLIVILTVSSFIPALNAVFYLFTADEYKRWWYMFILILAMASARVLDEHKTYNIHLGLHLYAALILVFWGTMAIAERCGKVTGVSREFVFTINILIAMGSSEVGHLMLKKGDKLVQRAIALTSVCAVVCMTGTLYLYRIDSLAGTYKQQYSLALQLKNYDDQYRYTLGSPDNIFTGAGDVAGLGAFSTTVSNSITEFNKVLGFDRYIVGLGVAERPGFQELVGGRYTLREAIGPEDKVIDTIKAGGGIRFVTENSVSPIGFACDSYITLEELERIEPQRRCVALLESAVVDNADVPKISALLAHHGEIDCDEARIPAYVQENQGRAVSSFARDNSGFCCQTDYSYDAVVYFSVPNDPGWTARIDGTETEIINMGGMMGIVVSAGTHAVEFSYFTPGLKLGAASTGVGMALFAAQVYYGMKKKKDDPWKCSSDRGEE